MSKLIKFKKQNSVAFITLNRPAKRNALLPEMIQGLDHWFQHTKKDPSLRAVVLKGEGPVFCSGADLQWLGGKGGSSKKEIQNLFNLLENIYHHPLPVISLVKGFVVGGGMGLVSVCDVVVAEKNTRFFFSEVKLGLVPSVISPFILKKIPLSQAKYFMLTGQSFNARQACQLSLVHWTGSQQECERFLKKLILSFQTLDPQAARKTKALLNHIHLQPLSHIKAQCVNVIYEMSKKPHTRDRIKALLTRSPTKK